MKPIGTLLLLAAGVLLCAGPTIIDVWIVPELPDAMVDLTSYRGMIDARPQWVSDRNPTRQTEWLLTSGWILSVLVLAVSGLGLVLSEIAAGVRAEEEQEEADDER